GRVHVRIFHTVMRDGTEHDDPSPAERHSFGERGSALWVWDPSKPELILPIPAGNHRPLAMPAGRRQRMLGSKAPRVEVRTDPRDKRFDEYPEESIAEWHERLGLVR